MTDAYAYNAWGELHGQLRDASDPNKPTNPLRFVGKEGCYTDDSTGLVLMGARYYDPLLGRFITQDPDRDGLNWYAYAGDNPVNATDATGMKPEPLQTHQRKLVQDALGLIERHNKDAYRMARAFLENGWILADPDMITEEGAHAANGRTFTFGWRLYLAVDEEDLTPAPAFARTPERRAAWYDDRYFGFVVDTATSLVHECTHMSHGGFGRLTTESDRKSYNAGLDFLYGLWLDWPYFPQKKLDLIKRKYIGHSGDAEAWARKAGVPPKGLRKHTFGGQRL